MKRSFMILAIALLQFTAAHAQQKQIEDNSFLIEEAYNQEKGVIQFINTFTRMSGGDFAYSFTNEYPMKGRRNQFSYTINALRADGRGGFGDTYINYRYQAVGMEEDARVAFSPRATLILPTGDYKKGTGTGAVGYQFNLPVSVKNTKKIVTHWNAGATVTPRARNQAGQRATTKGVNLGQSTIFLANPNFNVMFETYWARNEGVIAKDRTSADYTLLLNPGIRWAWNFKNGLQIVPGIAAPIGVGPSRGKKGVFLYLSFEK